MKKQGFTLIELMVVIVIMGILAAVAVPKLFGMIAKSKASEVPTAAGTWINMQEAYIQEKGEEGDWLAIGYTAPGVKSASTSSVYESNVFKYQETTKGQWHATVLKTALNDCEVGQGWGLEASVISSGDLKIASKDTDPDCKILTASWDNLERNAK